MMDDAKAGGRPAEDVERAVLGGVLCSPGVVIPQALGMGLTAAWFVTAQVRVAMAAALGMAARGREVDALLLADELRRLDRLDEAGGTSAIDRAVDLAPPTTAMDHYLGLIRRRHMLREIRFVGRTLAEKTETAEDPVALAAEGSNSLLKVAGSVAEGGEDNTEILERILVSWEDARAFQKGDESKRPATGLRMPISVIHDTMSGWEEGTMTLLGGRPSAGKTAFEDMCASTIFEEYEDEYAVLRWTMDSTPTQLLRRTLCRMAGVSLPKLKVGFARGAQIEEARRCAYDQVRKWPMFFYTGSDLEGAVGWIRSHLTKRKVGLVTIDFAQRIRLSGVSGWRAENENARLEVVSGALKDLVMQTGVRLLVLSQLSRLVEKEDRSVNRLSDLRGGGSLEQDADKVVFLSVAAQKREEMDLATKDATKHKRPIVFQIEKQKEGETGIVPLWMAPAYFRFYGPAETGTKVVKGRGGKEKTVVDLWSDDGVEVADENPGLF